ncbi:MAG: phytoene/squalene synthase family protein [Mesorhizobium sp.]|nr:phytoene/squalene synthase family protein [Mesorhizobium sp.]MCO5163640.1 phytoene/squalene synthase family protein [Mesorhizobium sp.]
MASFDPYLADIVRKADADRYLSVLYAPEAKRHALLSLYAFDAEIARIRDLVSEPMPGEIRLQWWRDVLSAGEASGHPIAAALLETIAGGRLPLQPFLDYLEARIFDLYDDPMPTRTDLEGYCGETASAVFQLAGMVLDADAAANAAALSGHAGCAAGVLRLLRLMPLHRRRGQCFVPAEVLAASGIDREAYLAGEPETAMASVVGAMKSLASEHLRAFLGGAAGLPLSLRPAFLPLATAPARLDRIVATAAWQAPAADISALRRHWELFRRAQRGW